MPGLAVRTNKNRRRPVPHLVHDASDVAQVRKRSRQRSRRWRLALFHFGRDGNDLREGSKLGGADVLGPDHGTTVSGPDHRRAGLAELDARLLGPHGADLDAEQPGLAAVDERLDEHKVKSLDGHRLRLVELLLPLVDPDWERIWWRSGVFRPFDRRRGAGPDNLGRPAGVDLRDLVCPPELIGIGELNLGRTPCTLPARPTRAAP